MSINQQTIPLDALGQRESVISIRGLITKIIRLNANKNNVDIAITSEKSKKTIIITESIENSIFKLGQFFKQKRRQRFEAEKLQWIQLLKVDQLEKLGADIEYSNDPEGQATFKIVIHD